MVLPSPPSCTCLSKFEELFLCFAVLMSLGCIHRRWWMCGSCSRPSSCSCGVSRGTRAMLTLHPSSVMQCLRASKLSRSDFAPRPQPPGPTQQRAQHACTCTRSTDCLACMLQEVNKGVLLLQVPLLVTSLAHDDVALVECFSYS